MARHLNKASNVPDIDKEEDCGSKVGKSCNTLHFNSVHLLQRMIETVEVSYNATGSGRLEGARVAILQ
jgi:hypothetical protein